MLKSIIFPVKSILDNFYRYLAIFSGHTGCNKMRQIVQIWVGQFFCSILYLFLFSSQDAAALQDDDARDPIYFKFAT